MPTAVLRLAGALIVAGQAVVYAQNSVLFCNQPGNLNASRCLFDGPTCHYATNFTNFSKESVVYAAYQKNPVPAYEAQFVIESGSAAYANGVLVTSMLPPPANDPGRGVATVVSTTRFLQYGTVEIVMRQSGHAGIVTSFILFSNDRDEIDLEFTGYDHTNTQFNWYAKGVQILNPEGSSVHGYITNTRDDNSEIYHTYTIDWTPDRITWSINGVPAHTANNTDGKFPSSPSRISFGLWHAQAGSKWAGDADIKTWVPPISAYFKSMRVTCMKNNGPNVTTPGGVNNGNDGIFPGAAHDNVASGNNATTVSATSHGSSTSTNVPWTIFLLIVALVLH
ncbi:GH16 domain-containing protein [Plasmodiophora brassicae]|uniref:GH16 domain-containing protein n=1 Tax=Plasmodiophora brassicae TaxID=37360 RepID=A0A3P3Y7I9_PLABS|nr:unnamed protein product [Plasmodiophora brassicae]